MQDMKTFPSILRSDRPGQLRCPQPRLVSSLKTSPYLALRHGVEVHPLRIEDEVGRHSAAFVDGDVAILESSSPASVSFDVLHNNLGGKWKKKLN